MQGIAYFLPGERGAAGIDALENVYHDLFGSTGLDHVDNQLGLFNTPLH